MLNLTIFPVNFHYREYILLKHQQVPKTVCFSWNLREDYSSLPWWSCFLTGNRDFQRFCTCNIDFLFTCCVSVKLRSHLIAEMSCHDAPCLQLRYDWVRLRSGWCLGPWMASLLARLRSLSTSLTTRRPIRTHCPSQTLSMVIYTLLSMLKHSLATGALTKLMGATVWWAIGFFLT